MGSRTKFESENGVLEGTEMIYEVFLNLNMKECAMISEAAIWGWLRTRMLGGAVRG